LPELTRPIFYDSGREFSLVDHVVWVFNKVVDKRKAFCMSFSGADRLPMDGYANPDLLDDWLRRGGGGLSGSNTVHPDVTETFVLGDGSDLHVYPNALHGDDELEAFVAAQGLGTVSSRESFVTYGAEVMRHLL
jgi:hypothetical protein